MLIHDKRIEKLPMHKTMEGYIIQRLRQHWSRWNCNRNKDKLRGFLKLVIEVTKYVTVVQYQMTSVDQLS